MKAPSINLPAGYEVVKINQTAKNIVAVVWTVPGGAPIYAAAAVASDVDEDKFWQLMLERVQHFVHGRWLALRSVESGVYTYSRMALSDKPPTTGEPHNG